MENKTKKTRYERTVDIIMISLILITEISAFAYTAKKQRESVRLYEQYEQAMGQYK